MSASAEAKAIAKNLRDQLAKRKLSLKHGACLEIVAALFLCKDWNVLSAKLQSNDAGNRKLSDAASLKPFEISGFFKPGSFAWRDNESLLAVPQRQVVMLSTYEAFEALKYYLALDIVAILQPLDASMIKRIDMDNGLVALAALRHGEYEDVMNYSMLINYADEFRPVRRDENGAKIYLKGKTAKYHELLD